VQGFGLAMTVTIIISFLLIGFILPIFHEKSRFGGRGCPKKSPAPRRVQGLFGNKVD
jgi:hypothetical protein